MSRSQSVVEFRMVQSRASLIRPADTTAYAAGDVIAEVTTNNHLVFPEVFRKGGPLTSCIDGARITSSSNATTKPDLELWLFGNDPTEVADNAAFAPTDAETISRIGIIKFPVANWIVGNAGAAGAGNAGCDSMNLGLLMRLNATPINQDALGLYGVLVVRNAYAPIASEEFTVDLLVYRD